MKVGDLVRSIGPSAPDLALVIGIVNEYRIMIMWCDTQEIDHGGKRLFEVISECR